MNQVDSLLAFHKWKFRSSGYLDSRPVIARGKDLWDSRFRDTRGHIVVEDPRILAFTSTRLFIIWLMANISRVEYWLTEG
jgi:hypothetical protein